jgi:VWFA-related protein
VNTNRTKILAAIVCLAGAFSVPEKAQTPADSGTVIRTETRVVLVDAVITDKKGAYVRDLKQKDFKVYEDGKEQQIKSFAFEADPNSPTNAQPRFVVLMFDNSTVPFGEQKYARDAAAKFIDSNAAPNRLMAVVNYGGAMQIVQNFTASVERLKAAVAGVGFSSVSPNPPSSGGLNGGINGNGGGPPQLRTQQSQFGALSFLLELRGFVRNLATVPGRKSLILFTGGFVVRQEQISELTAVIDACNRANVAIYPIDARGLVAGVAVNNTPSRSGSEQPVFRPAAFESQPYFVTWPMFLAMQAGRGGGTTGGGTTGGGTTGGGTTGGGRGGTTGGTTGTSGGTGRGGIGSGTNTGTGGLGGRAPSNGAVNNPVNPNVINNAANARALIPNHFPPSASNNQQLMYALADGTGGFVIINTNDLLGGLEKIGKEMNEFYLIGYTPPESKEGSCHTLHVKVERKDDNVRARTGYCDTKQKDVLTQTSSEQTLENRAKSPQAGTIAASIQAPFFFTSPNVARVTVAMEISPSDLKVEKDKGKFHATINVLGIATKPDGSVGARFSDAVKLDFEGEKEVEAFKQSKYHYENEFDAASGNYTLKVVCSSGGDSFGKVETPLTIEPYDGKSFMISAMAFSTKYGPAGGMGALLDAALIEDRTPLITQGVQVIPSGTNRFKQGQTPVVYLEVYEPLQAQPEPPKDLAVALQLLIFDSKTNEQKADTGLFRIPIPAHNGSPVITSATKMPSDKLEPGAYRLQLKAFDSANKGVTRNISFEIE